MKFIFYNDYELEFYISVIDDVIDDYDEKLEMLNNLKDEFLTELQSRRDG